MKPLWTQTLLWIVAVVTAVLLALSNADVMGFGNGIYRPQGASMPR